MRTVVCLLAVALVVASPPRAAAQDSTFVKLRCDANPGGTVRRTFLDAEGTPIRNGRAILSLDCSATSDSFGRFEITHIPPGTYQLLVSRAGYRRHPPQVVTVAADSVVQLQLRLEVANEALDCERQPACAATLRADSAGVAGLSSVQRLTYAAWRTAFALTGWTEQPAVSWRPCVEEPDSAVRQALHLSFVAGALWGVWWDCRFRRHGDDWAPEWCGIEAVS